jgi:hypothetical protein
MTFRDDGDAGDLFDGHGDYQHVGPNRARMRLAVLIVGGVLVAAIIGGMFLY